MQIYSPFLVPWYQHWYRRPWYRKKSQKYAGTAGTKNGTPGTKRGTAGTKSGTPGTKSGTAGTKSGTPGTKSGTPGTKSGTPGTKSGTPGTKSGPQVPQKMESKLYLCAQKTIFEGIVLLSCAKTPF